MQIRERFCSKELENELAKPRVRHCNHVVWSKCIRQEPFDRPRQDRARMQNRRGAYVSGARQSDSKGRKMRIEPDQCRSGDGGGFSAIASSMETAAVMQPLLKEIRHTPLLWMLVFVP